MKAPSLLGLLLHVSLSVAAYYGPIEHFGFDLGLNERELKRDTLVIHHDELAPYMREGDDFPVERATMRASMAHIRTRDDQNQDEDIGESKQRTIIYRPGYGHLCQQSGFSGATDDSRYCTTETTFALTCFRSGTIAPGRPRVQVIDPACPQGYFCSTVRRGTLLVVDPDNIPSAIRTDAVCVKVVEVDQYDVGTSTGSVQTAWTAAPPNQNVALGRLELTGNTSGVPISMTFYKRPKVNPGPFHDNIGTKTIYSTSHGSEHEYELSYNYNGAAVEFAGNIDFGKHPTIAYKVKCFWGFAS